MSDAPIIGSGKPHTVSLPEGSKVAAQARTRPAGGSLPETPPEAQRQGQVPDPLAQERPRVRLRRAKPSDKVAAATAAKAGARPAGAAQAGSLLARIAELEKHNAQVRASLDRIDTPPATPAD